MISLVQLGQYEMSEMSEKIEEVLGNSHVVLIVVRMKKSIIKKYKSTPGAINFHLFS
jgi:hypothetical protein